MIGKERIKQIPICRIDGRAHHAALRTDRWGQRSLRNIDENTPARPAEISAGRVLVYAVVVWYNEYDN